MTMELQSERNEEENPAKEKGRATDSLQPFTLQELRVLRLIGKGATGSVFLAKIEKTESSEESQTLALKLVSKDVSQRSFCCSEKTPTFRIQKEFEILSSLPSHPLLPRLVGHLETQTIVGFAVEYCPGGDLHRLRQLQPDGMFSDSAIRFYAAEVTLALEFLHSHGIIYRDLKAENILVRQNGHIMLADFDLSLQLTRSETGKSSIAGTDEYMAPEMISGRVYGTEVDFWCLGILLYEMSYGNTPFRSSSKDETFRRILWMDPPLSATANRPLNDLISKLLRKDPRRRATISDVKSHRFFAGLRWESVTNLLRPPFLPQDEEEENKAAESKAIDLQSVMLLNAFHPSTSESCSDEEGIFSE